MSIAIRVSTVATIAHADIEIGVRFGAKGELAAIVIACRLVDIEDDPLAVLKGCCGAYCELGNDGAQAAAGTLGIRGVVHIEAPVA